jgi:ABC-type uncharacterized transport system, permease component
MSDIAQRVHSLALKARKYAIAASTAGRERTAYRGSFLGSGLSFAIFVFVFSRIWSTVYAGRPAIEGYGRDAMVWYFIFAEIPGMSLGGSFWSLASDMKSGQVAYLISRPYGFVGYSLAQGLGRAAVNFGLLLALGLALGFAFAGPPPVGSLGQATAALGALLLACAVSYLCQLAIAMTAFWVEENTAFFWIYQKLMLIVGTFMPLEFLPGAVRSAAWWTPFPALSYAPARIVSVWPGADAALRLVGYQALWVAIAAAICQAVYASGRAKITVNGG